MFSLVQIGIGGFMGVYAGCMPITVNLARLPYWRGAIIGVFFGTLTQLLMAMIYLAIMMLATTAMADPSLKTWESWLFIGVSILCIQCLSSSGCVLMGQYFMSPMWKRLPFDRKKLYNKLKAKDSGKRSVLHDVVQKLEVMPASPDVRYSTGWVILFGVISIGTTLIWLQSIKKACIAALFFGEPVDFSWFAGIFGECLIPVGVLVLIQFSVLFWLCRDIKLV